MPLRRSGAVMRLSREDESWNQLLEAGQAGTAPDQIKAGSWEPPQPGSPAVASLQVMSGRGYIPELGLNAGTFCQCTFID